MSKIRLMPCLRPLLVPLFALVPLAALAAPARYVLDPVHTRVLFAIDHAGFSKALGTVSGSTGTLVFDPEDWRDARVEVNVPIAHADLGDPKWNHATLARNLLDSDHFPEARFVSTQVEPQGPDRARVIGLLTLRGVTREVVLEVTFNALKRRPLPPFRRTAGFSATATIKRSDFGIDAWKSVIGDTVQLRIEVEAERRGQSDAPTDTATDATSPPPEARP